MFSAIDLTSVNVAIDAFGISIVLVILASIHVRPSERNKNNIWLLLTLTADIIWSVCDLLIHLWSGSDVVIPLKIVTFIYFIFAYGIAYFFSMYLFAYFGGYLLSKSYRVVISCTLIVYAVLLGLTPENGYLYIIDADNVVSRGPLYFVPVFMQLFCYATFFKFLFSNLKYLNMKKLPSVFMFLALPQISEIVQLFIPEISFMSAGFPLGFIVIFLDMSRSLEKVLDSSLEVVRQKDARLIQVQDHTILSLSSLVEERDTDTGGHVQRTSEYVKILATELMQRGIYSGIINSRYIYQLERAAPMHDIGKIVVSDSVLKKPGRLTEEEFESMKKHALEGGRIILEVLDEYEDHDYVKITTEIATYHHEKWDGSGYPKGLKGDEIPLSARIMALADVFDALVSPRVYKKPMTYDEAFELIEKEAGTHFDPVMAKVFLDSKKKMIQVNEDYLEKQRSLMVPFDDVDEIDAADDGELEELEDA